MRIHGVLLAAALFSPPLSADPQVRYSPFWTSIPDCITTMHLRNNLVNAALTVSPVLYLEDGTPLTLKPVTIPASGSAEIPVNQTVWDLGYRGAHFGGAEFHFDSVSPKALAVETEVVMPEGNLAYSVQSFTLDSRSLNEQHAVFRLPTRDSGIYFAMHNSSDETVTVTPTIQSGNRPITLDAVRIPPHGFSKVRLEREDIRGGLKSVGGVTLRHRGPAGALFTTGWIDDDEIGFSTMMTFEELGQSHPRTELFGTQIFTSYVRSDIVLKNMSTATVQASAEFYFVQNGNVGTAALNIGPIQAGSIRSVDIGKLQKRGLLPSAMDELSVRIRYAGEPGALMGRIFGISESGTYGYYSQLEDRTSARRTEIYWTAREGAKTLATIANFGDDDVVTVELFNADGESYSTEVRLAASETKTIDLAQLGRDAFGAGSSGGWNVSRNGGGSLVVKNHVVDRNGLSLPFYGEPQYVTGLRLTPNPINLDSDNDSGSILCQREWDNGLFLEDSAGGESATEDSNVATVSGSSDPYGNWDVEAVGPGGGNWIRVAQWIPGELTQSGSPEEKVAQTNANVKCKIAFGSLVKTSNRNYRATVSVNSNACGDSQSVSIGLAPVSSGCGTGHTWSYAGNGSESINAGQGNDFNIAITHAGGETPVTCAHRFTPVACANCEVEPGHRDGDASSY